MRLGLFTIPLVLLACDESTAPRETAEMSHVVYGVDDRRDVYEVSDPALLNAANSVVSIIDNDKLLWNGNGYTLGSSNTLQRHRDLCSTEPFLQQPTASDCSAVLIAPDKVATAGHCVDPDVCSTQSFVFGYEMNSATAVNSQYGVNDVYQCSAILFQQDDSEVDLTVLQLDRDVVGHPYMPIRHTGDTPLNTPLVLMGFPNRIPLKIADGGEALSSFTNYFRASVDAFGGNSGSPVFNRNTLELEGILVGGSTDYIAQGSCNVVNVCSETGCPGLEQVMRASLLAPWSASTPPPTCSDAYEPNQVRGLAVDLGSGSYPLEICPNGDDDWFNFDLDAGETIDITVTFTDSLGDLDIVLSDGSTELATSAGVTDVESVSYTATSAQSVQLRVYGYNDDANSYVLDVQMDGDPIVLTLQGPATVDAGDWYTFTASDVGATRPVLYLGNPNRPPSPMPGCGIDLDIGNRRQIGRLILDGAGGATYAVRVPPNTSPGVFHFQAADLTECVGSNVMSVEIQ